jgi:hypothetical protein
MEGVNIVIEMLFWGVFCVVMAAGIYIFLTLVADAHKHEVEERNKRRKLRESVTSQTWERPDERVRK